MEQRLNVNFISVEVDDNPDVSFGVHYPINPEVYRCFLEGKACPASFIRGIHVYFDEQGRIQDPLASIFYILNCLGEGSSLINSTDPHGRLLFKESIYSDYHDPYTDLLTPLMRSFLKNYAGVEHIDSFGKRQVLLSHDIDFLRSGFKQELLYFFRNPEWDLAVRLVKHLFTGNKLWSNIRAITALEKEFEYRSVFYFLPKSGSYNGVTNADYKVPEMRAAMDMVYENNMECGLHKSTSDLSYHEEVCRLGQNVKSNRNHFLRYNLPDSWKEISEAYIPLDAGLGWSDQEGLRNGYPAPFNPYGIELTVVPLVLMDTTFYNRKKGVSMVGAFSEMQSCWPDGYCVTILFHNNYLTPWSNKFYLDQYRQLLEYLKKEEIEVILTSDIIQDYAPKMDECI